MNMVYVFIFIMCILFYIHIFYHLKVANEEKIYEIDYQGKKHLEDVCDLRQPFTLHIQQDPHLLLQRKHIENIGEPLNVIKKTSVEDVNKETKETTSVTHIYSEYNKKLLKTDRVNNHFKKVERFFMPDFSMWNQYDIIVSDANFSTPLQSNYFYRNYIHVNEGNVKIRIIPPNEKPKLDGYFESDLFKHVSKCDIWNTEKTEIKYFEIVGELGDVIYIPPHWWYSMQFQERSVICCYHYRTLMNILAYLPNYVQSFMSITKQNDIQKKKKPKEKKK